MANYLATSSGQASDRTQNNVDGVYNYSYKQDIYSQILVIPEQINAGNVSQTTTFKVVLWNTTDSVQKLTSISEVGTTGMLLTGKGTGDMSPNSHFDYTLDLTTQGPAFIDAKYHFNFESGVSDSFAVTGSRVVLFDFDINWRQLPKESFSHYTDVRVAYDGTEYRHNLTENPRFQMQYYYTLTDEERMRLDGLLYSWADKIFLVPIYSQLTNITSDIKAGDRNADIKLENTDIQVGMSLYIGNNKKDGEIVNVKQVFNDIVTFDNSIEKDYKNGTFVTPLCQAYINSQSKTSSQNNEITEIIANFDVQDNTILTITDSVDNFEEYDGMKILTQEPNRQITIDRSYARLVDVVDYGSGVRSRVSKDKKPAVVFNYTFDCIGKKEINNVKSFFNNMRGMTDEFLVSTFSNDMKLARNISAGENTLIIKNTGVGTYYLNNAQKSMIIFYLSDGTKEIRKIVNVLYNTEETERLVIDSPLNRDLNVQDIQSIQFLSHARFNSDSIEFEYETDEYARANTEIRILRG